VATARSRPARLALDGETLDLVKQSIAVAPGGATKADVLAATGLSDSRWNAAINALLDQGTVLRTGEGRGTRYLLREEGAHA
jgi:hypothetical protein